MSAPRNPLFNMIAVLPLLGAGQQADLVTINARDVELASLLEQLSAQHRINLVCGDEVTGRVTINLFDVKLDEALTQILATRGLAYIQQGDFYRVVTEVDFAANERLQDIIETRVFNLNHLTGREAQVLLAPLMSNDGQFSITGGNTNAQGGSASNSENGGSMRELIVVRDHRSSLEVIQTTIDELDQPPQQVLLEATILAVELGEENVLGVNFNVLGGTDFDALGAETNLVGMGDYHASGSTLDDLLFSGQTFGFTNNPLTEGLSLGLVKNQVAVFLEALEETTNASILSNPKVIALNGQEARIIVGGRLGYTTVVSTNTSEIEQVNFLETGTQLTFKPTIGDDGWIRMDVHPQNSTGILDPVTGIPSESTAEITTSVLMRDGQTLVIGGLISERLQTARSQVPYLGSLPVIGFLFGRTSESLQRSELVILLTPHIINPVEEERRAREIKERWDAVHRSHLDSLSPHLRPQQAASLTADAEVLRIKGDLDGALGSVERALSLDPTSVHSAMLRQELLREITLGELPLDEEQQSLQVLDRLDSLRAPRVVPEEKQP